VKKIIIKEFEVIKSKSDRRVYIKLNKPLVIVLGLTYQEWDNLFNFLKKTKSKVHLPKHKIQYNHFDIDSNKCQYKDSRPYNVYSDSNYHLDSHPLKLYIIRKSYGKSLRRLFEKFNRDSKRFNQKSREKNRRWEKQRIERCQKEAKRIREDAKNNLVSRTVSLRAEKFFIRMQRKQFLRFRECCLNLKSSSLPSK
jgi:hypothetical protein